MGLWSLTASVNVLLDVQSAAHQRSLSCTCQQMLSIVPEYSPLLATFTDTFHKCTVSVSALHVSLHLLLIPCFAVVLAKIAYTLMLVLGNAPDTDSLAPITSLMPVAGMRNV